MRSVPVSSLLGLAFSGGVSLAGSIAGLAGSIAGLAGSIAGLAGCTNDPLYLPGPMSLEAGTDMMGMLTQATASLPLPIKTETAEDQVERAALTAELGVDVPYVKVGDIEVSVEWTITNLDSMPGEALIQLNGANEAFVYDPALVVIDPEDEDEEAPGLEGDIPIHVPASGTVSGVFTEDKLREASVDLDQITRGNINPFRATLTISKNAREFQPLTEPMPLVPDYVQTPLGPAIPRAAFRQMIRIDLVFKPDRPMRLEYNVRVRDIRGIMHDLLLAAMTERPGELQLFEPVPYLGAATVP